MSLTLDRTYVPSVLELELSLELMRESLYRAEQHGEDPQRIERAKEDIYSLMETLHSLQAVEPGGEQHVC